MVKEGRISVGKPTCSCAAKASFIVWQTKDFGQERPIFSIASLKRPRSSALSIASSVAPINSTLYFANTPLRAKSSAQFSAVWPPIVGRIASGRSLAIIFSTVCHIIGSM